MSNNVPPSPSVLNRLIRLEELEKENARLKSELDRVVTQQQDKSAAKGASLFSEKQSLSSSSSGTGSAASSPALKSLKQGVISVVVLGASGDLAVKKTYPALFSLYCHGLLSKNFFIIGYARTAMSIDDYKKKISSKFPTAASKEQKEEFLSHCYYINGQYDNIDDYKRLDTEILKLETSTLIAPASRVFYFAIPPNIFYTVAKGIAEACLSKQGWNRIIVEKPFGHDFESSAILNRQIGSLFEEDQIYRIDHYLGKEMVQNLMVLRFANKVFEPIWNRNNIQCVLITFKEDFGTQGRGGYFDSFGIIRDVMQNHLFQILSLVAMEPPVTLNAEDVRDEKVKLLRAIKPLDMNDLVIGQYGTDPKGKESSYLDDPTVPNDSITPTYALGVFHIHNERWAGTPFILKCGKALNERKAEIRIQFRTPLNNLFHDSLSNNELVLRVQPDEAVYLKLTAKQPGLEGGVRHTELDLSYKTRFAEAKSLPDAYERLIYDVIRGDHNLFVRADELSAAWSIFTPVLHQLEKEKIKPILYEYGSRGPKEADELSFKYGYNRTLGYKWIDQPLSSSALVHNSSAAGSKL